MLHVCLFLIIIHLLETERTSLGPSVSAPDIIFFNRTPEDASRIQSAEDRKGTAGDQAWKARAQAAAAKHDQTPKRGHA